MFLSQKGYIEWVSSMFGMQDAKSVVTPLAPHFKISCRQSPITLEDKRYMEYVAFAIVVDSLIYAMACTCPYISQAVTVVSRFMANPKKAHWEDVKWVLRYLKGTTNIGL